ncbi:hypothetical protein [Paraburkholderia youngii]|uniref:hypothetical protein n=1 Tax=Paraburkholderia youngii TaxID=2782701 RepID=UPI003D234C25
MSRRLWAKKERADFWNIWIRLKLACIRGKTDGSPLSVERCKERDIHEWHQSVVRFGRGTAVGVAGQPKVATERVAEPLTGGQLTFGRSDESGVRIAVENVNKVSGAATGRSVTFEVLSEDDAVGREPGASSVQKTRLFGRHDGDRSQYFWRDFVTVHKQMQFSTMIEKSHLIRPATGSTHM